VSGSVVVVHPSFITTGGSSSVTAYILGAGTTLFPGDGLVTLAGGATISLPPSGSGDGRGSGSDILLTLAGSIVTVHPTVIPMGETSATAYALSPGTTLIPGGEAVTLAGGATISLPAPTPDGGTGPGTAGSDIFITLSGSVFTVHPSVIPSSGENSITAYVLGAGTTLSPGGEAVTLTGGATISILPLSPAPTLGTTTDIGGAILSGLGYTGVQYTGSAHRDGPCCLLCVLFAAILCLIATV
jgi:hypothetical protein